MTNEATDLIEVNGLSKEFPGVVANDAVSFTVGHGEIHALLGENGAGKSTLVKMIYGVQHPDRGTMRLRGAAYAPASPAAARAQGIGMVFQHFSLFDALSVEQNIALGVAPELAKKGLRQRIIDISNHYGLPLDPDETVGCLSIGLKQRVEIVRCLLQKPQLLIMDEPTSVLTPSEVNILFKTLRQIAQEGCSILYISHKLKEILTLCHRATILRTGTVVATCIPKEETAESLATMMMGETLTRPARNKKEHGDVRLTIKHLSDTGSENHGSCLWNVSLQVHAGEIVGIAGVAGNGQRRLLSALVGEFQADKEETIIINGIPAGKLGPDDRRALGMCCVPEERLGHATVPDMSLVDNTILSARIRKNLKHGNGLLNMASAKTMAEEIVCRFKVKTTGTDHIARSLSGGNLQKFIMGREIMQNPGVFVAAQPTWGVDAGAAADIHEAIMELTRNGTAVLIISQDLDELFFIADRIAVISEGVLSEATAVEALSVEKIGLQMGEKLKGEEAND